jgi:hypothetical protein
VPWTGPAAPSAPIPQPTTNESPVLPANAHGGVAKAAAIFERIYTIAADADAGSAVDALARIQGIAEAAIGDVGRFASASLRQSAGDEADQLIRSI